MKFEGNSSLDYYYMTCGEIKTYKLKRSINYHVDNVRIYIWFMLQCVLMWTCDAHGKLGEHSKG